jgi:hypothetical protein
VATATGTTGPALVVDSALVADSALVVDSALVADLFLAGETSAGRASSGDLDDDVGGLDHGHRKYPRLELQFIRGFATHQRDHPKRSGLHLHLSHHGVSSDLGNQAGEAISGGLAAAAAIWGMWLLGGQLFGEPSQHRTVNRSASARVGRRRQPTRFGPPPDGVVADSQQFGRLLDPERRHDLTLRSERECC